MPNSKPNPLPLFSWRICWTMIYAEIRVMSTMFGFTILPSIINAILLIIVFGLLLPIGFDHEINGIAFLIFITPGLVMMNIFQNAFSQPAFAIVSRRMFGSLNELLLTPINPVEMVLAQIFTGTVRGVAIGTITFVACLPFVPNITIMYPFTALFYILSASILLALLGLLCGLIAQKWEQLSIYTNFILIPLSFLSGTFYSIKSLSPFFQTLTYYNPLFYLIDGLRYSFTGQHENGNMIWGMILVWTLNIILFAITTFLLHRGYRLRG